MFIGKKVILRAYGNYLDDDCLVRWRNDPQVKAFFFEEEPLSFDSHSEWIDKVLCDPNARYYMIQTIDDTTIGAIGLSNIDWRNRTAEFGRFLIGEAKYRGWGYGMEAVFLLLDYAFNHLNLNKIWLETMALNEGARAVYQKMGFQEEGILREQKFKNGKYIDVYIHGLLRDAFNALRETLIKELDL